jgi:aminobenzoyl-glutamate utilization protein B
MRTRKFCFVVGIFGLLAVLAAQTSGQVPSITAEQSAELKQQILGFQEFETSQYLTTLLEKNGFKVEHGISGIPTAWMATWGSGEPVIALGSDLDCIPQASQKPGVAYHDPIIPGAPGHGEGHNSGQAVNIVAALAVKDVMIKNHLSGTIKIWPGVAEELLGSKAYYVRDGYFKGIDAVLFSHVGDVWRVLE